LQNALIKCVQHHLSTQSEVGLSVKTYAVIIYVAFTKMDVRMILIRTASPTLGVNHIITCQLTVARSIPITATTTIMQGMQGAVLARMRQ